VTRGIVPRHAAHQLHAHFVQLGAVVRQQSRKRGFVKIDAVGQKVVEAPERDALGLRAAQKGDSRPAGEGLGREAAGGKLVVGDRDEAHAVGLRLAHDRLG
jgi:hypothetical protein